MPVNFKKTTDKNKVFYYTQWGTTGKKYYFDPKSTRSIMIAYKKAVKQGQAISISKRKKF